MEPFLNSSNIFVFSSQEEYLSIWNYQLKKLLKFSSMHQ